MTLPPGLQVRPIAARDIDAVRAIEAADASAPHWSEAEYRKLFPSHGCDPHVQRAGIVAAIQDEVIGFAIVRRLKVHNLAEAELESIAVAPAWQRKGVGTALLLELSRSAQEQGIHECSLEVRASNQAAIQLYRRAGFREAGRRPGYYQNPDEDAVLMSALYEGRTGW